jgi:hypothetical protein
MWCGTRVPSVGTTSQLDQGVQHRVVGDLFARAPRDGARVLRARQQRLPRILGASTPRGGERSGP